MAEVVGGGSTSSQASVALLGAVAALSAGYQWPYDRSDLPDNLLGLE